MKTTRIVLVACALSLVTASMTAAQGATGHARVFFSVNFASQSGSQQFDETRTWSLYDEPASFSGPHKVSGGSLLDIGGGVRLWQKIGVGVSISSMSDTADVNLSGQLPNPLFVDRYRTASTTATGLAHKATAVHLQALYMVPIGERMVLTVSAGPTFLSVKQDRVENLSLTEAEAPYTSVTISGVSTVNRSVSKAAFNAGADVAFYVTRVFGAGVYVRYSGTSVSLPAPMAGGNEATLDVGGVQFGGGLRVRF